VGDPLVVSEDRELLAIERLQQRGRNASNAHYHSSRAGSLGMH
jgi:hypothetical protein